MAQFGIHALIGLWIAWALPMFSPYILRVSFAAGIYFGCVFPDIDIYAAAIAEVVRPGSAMSYHRNLTHSVLVAFALLVLFAAIELLVRNKKKRHEHHLYEIEAANLDDDALLALSGALSSQEKYLGIDFKVFGLGLFSGMLIHILLDILFWFAPINLLFPLPNLGIGRVIDAWEYKPNYTVTAILSLSELLCMAAFFLVLRMCVKSRLGKWADVPEDVAARKRAFTDNDIEHSSMDFSLHTQEDICPIDQKTLARARPALFASKVLIIFQFLYFVAACMTPFILKGRDDVLQYVVFVELMAVCIPAYVYLSVMLRDVILRKLTN